MNKWYIDERSQQSYTYAKVDKINRNGNRSLQRNMINLNQPLINRNGYNYLNQSVEGDMLMINSRFSPTNDNRFGYANDEVKRTNSSIKINPESEDVVMPLENASKNTKIKAGRMCSTLNNFYKKSHIWKPKQKHVNKAKIYTHENDYTSSDKVVSNERKRLKKVKNQFLITSHPYMQDRSSFQSRCGSDLKFNWKSGMKKSPNGSDIYDHQAKNNLTELNASNWKPSKELNGRDGRSPEYYSK